MKSTKEEIQAMKTLLKLILVLALAAGGLYGSLGILQEAVPPLRNM